MKTNNPITEDAKDSNIKIHNNIFKNLMVGKKNDTSPTNDVNFKFYNRKEKAIK